LHLRSNKIYHLQTYKVQYITNVLLQYKEILFTFNKIHFGPPVVHGVEKCCFILSKTCVKTPRIHAQKFWNNEDCSIPVIHASGIRTPLFLYQFKNIRIQGRNDRMKLTKISENRMDKNARR